MHEKSILDDKRVVSKIINREIQSIKESKEKIFSVCGDGKIVDILPARGSSEFYPVVDLRDINRNCKPDQDIVIFHSHEVGSASPSGIDHVTFKKAFQKVPMAVDNCIVGVEGIFCVDRDGKHRFKKFDEKQQSKILKSTGFKKWTGDSVFCDRVKEGDDESYSCFVQEGDDPQRYMGDFGEASLFGGAMWVADSQSDVSMFSPFPGKKIECMGSPGEKITCILEDSLDR